MHPYYWFCVKFKKYTVYGLNINMFLCYMTAQSFYLMASPCLKVQLSSFLKVLGKLIDVSVYSTKITAGKSMTDYFRKLSKSVCVQNTNIKFIEIVSCQLSIFTLQWIVLVRQPSQRHN